MSTTDPALTRGHAPAPTLELVATQVVQPVLGVTAIGANDDFFDYEATSLHMVQMVAKVHQIYGIELPLPELFDEPTLSGLVWLIERELAEAEVTE